MRTWILTMAYANSRVFNAGARSLRDTVDLRACNAKHVILDQHYPLERKEVKHAIEVYRSRFHDSTVVLDANMNLGLHDGLNFILDALKSQIADDDVIVGYDPDEAPERDGWLAAMLDVFATSSRLAWLSLNCPAADAWLSQHGCEEISIRANGRTDPIRVRSPNYALINTVCAWRWSVVKEIGKFEEPHRWYGGLEVAMMPKFWKAGYRVGWMRDYFTANHRHMADQTYEDYKHHHVGHKLPVFPGSFEEWIEK